MFATQCFAHVVSCSCGRAFKLFFSHYTDKLTPFPLANSMHWLFKNTNSNTLWAQDKKAAPLVLGPGQNGHLWTEGSPPSGACLCPEHGHSSVSWGTERPRQGGQWGGGARPLSRSWEWSHCPLGPPGRGRSVLAEDRRATPGPRTERVPPPPLPMTERPTSRGPDIGPLQGTELCSGPRRKTARKSGSREGGGQREVLVC